MLLLHVLHLLLLLLLLITSSGATLTPTAFAPPCLDVTAKTVRLGAFPGIDNPFRLALAGRYLSILTGYTVTWQRVYGGGMGVRMLDEGQICMSLIGSSPIAGSQLRGLDIELIGMYGLIGDAEHLVVKDSIGAPEDLEGKIIVTALDSTAHFHLLLEAEMFGVTLGGVVDANNIKDASGDPITFQAAWDAGLVDGIQMWGSFQSYATTNGGHKLIGAKEMGAWGKPTFDGLASRKDVSGADPALTSTLLGVLGSVNEAFLSKSPREWTLGSSEMQAALAVNGKAPTSANYDSFIAGAAGSTFLTLDEMRSCSHVGCGLSGVDANALKAVNTFKMDIKAAPVMQPDSLWVNSTNADYLHLAKASGASAGYVTDIDTFDQSQRDNMISNYTTINYHGNSYSETAAHGAQCSGTTTISTDSTFSDGHLSGLSYHDNADCTWILDSGTATDTATLTVSFLDIGAGWDTLTVTETLTGDVLAVFSGVQTPPPISAIGGLTVRFATDGKQQIFAENKEAGFTASVTFTQTAITSCAEGKYGADCSSNYCYGKTSMSSSGNLRAEHRNLASCFWELTADSGNVIELAFTVFAFEYGADYVEVFDSDGTTLLGKFTGFDLPPKLVSSGQKMHLKLSADDLVWQGQGFMGSFSSVTPPASAECDPGKFGPFCDVEVCFGETSVAASPSAPSGVLLSGKNYPGGVDCSWVMGASSDGDTFEGVTVSFNDIHIEPDPEVAGNAPDQLLFLDGSTTTALYTVRGKSSQCSKNLDCNPSSTSSTPSMCVFQNPTDVFGTCQCEAGYSNGDCSESLVTLKPSSGFLTVTYVTDINDPITYRGWNISYSFCGESLGYASCNALSDIIVADSNADGVALEVVFVALAVVAVVLVAAFMWHHRESIYLKKQVTKRDTVISKLKEELTLLKSYGDEEQKLIGEEIMTFRENFARHREKNAGAEDRALEKFLIPASEVVPHKQIGKGSFGEVFLANYRGQDVAVKTMSEVSPDNLTRFREEILLMSDLRHPNVVFMVGACWEKQLMALVLEFCENGTAQDNLTDKCSWEDPLLQWSKDVAAGICYLHGISFFDIKNQVQVQNLIHRDIKPDNCLVTDTFGIKVSDFGEARVSTDATMTMVGTPFYVAPEVVKGDHYTTSADVYSYGMTVLCFAIRGSDKLGAYLKKAYAKSKKVEGDAQKAISDNRVAHMMVNKNWRPTSHVDDLGLPPTVASLLEICWQTEPSERPTFKEILEYLQNEVTEEVMDGGKRGTGRKTSTVGMVVHKKILAAKQAQEEREKAAKREEVSDAVSRDLEGDTKRRSEMGGGIARLVEVIKDKEGGVDLEEINAVVAFVKDRRSEGL